MRLPKEQSCGISPQLAIVLKVWGHIPACMIGQISLLSNYAPTHYIMLKVSLIMLALEQCSHNAQCYTGLTIPVLEGHRTFFRILHDFQPGI